MASVIVLVSLATYRASVRQYNKRKAKKFGYDDLEHDYLWRPIDQVNGKKLSRNEARALAQYRREQKSARAQESERFEKGNVLPAYNSVVRQSERDHAKWRSGSVLMDDVNRGHLDEQRIGSSSSNDAHPHDDVTQLGWSASPTYPSVSTGLH